MKFKTIHPTYGEREHTYDVKNRKVAEQIILLHQNMGDGIRILEDDESEEAEVSGDS